MPNKTAEPKSTTGAEAEAAGRRACETVLSPPAPIANKPGPFAHLARIMSSKPDEEVTFLVQFLEDSAKRSTLTLQEIALHNSAHALGIHLMVEDITNYAEDFNGLTMVTLQDRGWLYRFMHQIFRRVARKEYLEPKDVMETAAVFLTDQDERLDTAREVLRDHPQLVAAEIRKAVARRPELARCE